MRERRVGSCADKDTEVKNERSENERKEKESERDKVVV